MATRTKKAPPVVEDEAELEELDSDAEEGDGTEAEKELVWGVQDLCKLLKKKTGKDYKPREVRTLLRKMAREKNPRVSRVIEADNRTRYAWGGPEDPEVKRIIKAVTGGEIEANKTEALQRLKADKAAKMAAETKPGKKGSKKGAKVVEPEEDEDEELDELDEDEE